MIQSLPIVIDDYLPPWIKNKNGLIRRLFILIIIKLWS